MKSARTLIILLILALLVSSTQPTGIVSPSFRKIGQLSPARLFEWRLARLNGLNGE